MSLHVVRNIKATIQKNTAYGLLQLLSLYTFATFRPNSSCVYYPRVSKGSFNFGNIKNREMHSLLTFIIFDFE